MGLLVFSILANAALGAIHEPPPAAREAALFICCDVLPEEWPIYIANISAHRANVTSVIIALYTMSRNGTFESQGPHDQVLAGERAAASINAMGIAATALIAVNPSGLRLALYDSAVRQRFISSAVARARQTGITGYNLDAEFPNDENSTDGVKFIDFLNAMATALHNNASNPASKAIGARKKTLSVDVHGDGDTPFDFHVWGPQFQTSAVDRVVTMATYTASKTAFDKYFAESAAHIGPEKLQVGLERNQVLVNPKNIAYILSKNVSAIAVWAPNPVLMNSIDWAAMGSFLRSTPRALPLPM